MTLRVPGYNSNILGPSFCVSLTRNWSGTLTLFWVNYETGVYTSLALILSTWKVILFTIQPHSGCTPTVVTNSCAKLFIIICMSLNVSEKQ